MRRVFDEEHIDNAVLEARRQRGVISHAAARVISSQLHGGQGSALYALSSSGAITAGLLEEVDHATKDRGLDPLARYWATDLEHYLMVRIQNGEWDGPTGWNQLWLGEETEAGIATSAWTDDDEWSQDARPEALEATPVERAQKLYDRDAPYQDFLKEFTREELVELWSLCGAGMTYSFDDEVYDALANGYNHFEQQLVFGKSASDWHAQLTGDNLEVPASRYGRNASEVAWWAVASLYVYSAFYGEQEDAEGYAENAMSMVVNDHESIVHFIREHKHYVPKEVVDELRVDGEAI